MWRGGEFLALIGASGSGKTTLLKLINRLVEPTRGSIAVDGKPVAGGDPALLAPAHRVCVSGRGLVPAHDGGGEHRRHASPAAAGTKPAIDARVSELLDLVRLPRDLAGRLPGSLSGGQAQRVGVARALAAKPSIMLMDEPFGAVDPITRDALTQDYRALHDALGLTTVMVTHDVFEAVLLADRIAVMEEGELVESGSTQDLLANAKRPSVRALMDMPRRQAQRISALTACRGPMTMVLDPRVAEAWERLPEYLGAHVVLSLSALALGLALSLPLALWGARSRNAAQGHADACQHHPDHPQSCAARAFLSVAARSFASDQGADGRTVFGARVSTLAAGADALQHAAGPAEHGDRAAWCRCGR